MEVRGGVRESGGDAEVNMNFKYYAYVTAT